MAFLEVFEMNKVTVKIANQEYTVVGEESKEYLLKIASRVDDEMEDLLLKILLKISNFLLNSMVQKENLKY